MVNEEVWHRLTTEFAGEGVLLVAVSKTKPAADIRDLYELGQRHFGENYVQELVDKQAQLPPDILWHYIGHLQTNKVRFIAPFVHLVHAVDSFKLLAKISRQGARCNRVIDVLLQMHIATEDTKFGMDGQELTALLHQFAAQQQQLQHVRICGLMGMATNTADEQQVRNEFARLHQFFLHLRDTMFLNQPHFAICSMGMSADYALAIQEGATMVRIGSMLFGSR